MNSQMDSEERALADRLVSYADAIVAVCVVGASGIGAVIADPDSREHVARAANYIIVANVLSGILLTALVTLLRRWEIKLRANLPDAPLPRAYSRYLHGARIVLVWLSAGLAITLMTSIR